MDEPMPISLESEVESVDLGDARRDARLLKILSRVAAKPGSSLPDTFTSSAELEATYRFLNNPAVSAEAILAGHHVATTERAAARDEVLVLHDTTTFAFNGVRTEMGTVEPSEKAGFYAHVSLCVGMDGEPLGVPRELIWHRFGERRGKRSQQESQYDPNRESLRWNEAVHDCGDLLADHPCVVHVMDREGDCMELLADMQAHGHRFVVRLAHDRRLIKDRRKAPGPKLFEVMRQAPIVLEREVVLARRPAKTPSGSKSKHEWLAGRTAHLEVRAQRLEISPGNGAHAHIPDVMTLNFVDVCETNPPEGREPVTWRLCTTEPIETPADVARVVDIYRRRWLIEELFKAIKTGCAYETLQLVSGSALIRALAIFVPVAWRMLRLRWVERQRPESPAIEVLTPVQTQVLQALAKRDGKPLPPKPTARDVLRAIARLGGHIPNNGSPGWLVLRRGFEKLLLVELGWSERAALDTS